MKINPLLSFKKRTQAIRFIGVRLKVLWLKRENLVELKQENLVG
jgi:hypothetical protein